MHATYLFLFPVSDLNAPENDLKDEAEDFLSAWATTHFDENNWFQTMCLITQNNRVIQMAESDDWRKRDTVFSVVKEEGGESPFLWARRHALNCVVTDLECFNVPKYSIEPESEDKGKERERLDALPFDKLVEEAIVASAKALERSYSEVASDPLGKKVTGLTSYRRERLSSGLEKLLDSPCKPFAFSGTPYDYRAFMAYGLKWDGELPEPACAILLVDIHT